MQTLTKKQRVDAAINNKAVDRAPVSLWRHFYECEDTAESLAGAMLGWHRKFDWDWMKINPRASYHVEGWGVQVKFSGDALIKPEIVDYPIKSVADWGKLKPLPLDTPALDEQIEVAERICETLGGDAYALQTVFSPLSIAGDLLKTPQELLEHIRSDPQAVHGALQVITATFREFAREVVESGADGIFFATTHWASRELMSDELYAEFGRPYDLQVLEVVQEAAFNVLHVCKNHAMVLALGDYPVHAINWAVGAPGNPPLRQVQLEAGKCVIGGIRNETLVEHGPAHINAEARAAREQTGGRWFMLGPSCSIPVETPEENVRAVRDIAEQMTGNEPMLPSEEVVSG